jgi:hypothetical protein
MARESKESEWVEEYGRRIPPVILMIGNGAWTLVGTLSNIDFILSIQNDTFRRLFSFFNDFGSWALIVIGAIWFMNPSIPKRRRILTWPLFVSSAIVAFMAGVLLTVIATGEVPRVLLEWGAHGSPDCYAVLDSSRLLTFKKKYDVGLICGYADSSTDKLTNTSISVSQLFTIVPGRITISAKASDGMMARIHPGTTMTRWHEAVLLPKGFDMTKIMTLNDVMKAGGKIINPVYWDD